MNAKYQYKDRRLNPMYFGIIVALITLVFVGFFFSSEWRKNQQREKIQTFEEYLSFQSRVEALVNDSINFLRGYNAYLIVDSNISITSSKEYLDALLGDANYPVKNIAILEDTTIISVYPEEGNAVGIGIDLAQVEDQKNDVNFVKNNLKPIFVGPVNLVEGGQGFIARLPIIRENEYYGQVSIVLGVVEIMSSIEQIALDTGLLVNISNGDTKLLTMLADDEDSLELEMELIGTTWSINAKREEQSVVGSFAIVYMMIASLAISITLGVIAGIIYRQRIDLKKLAFTDYLTGVYNRNFIEHFIPMVFNRAIRENHSVGVFHMDINDFKLVNDMYGHHIGDMVLQDFAKRIQGLVRNYEVVFRLGGDEFMVVATGITEEEEFNVIFERLNEGLNYLFERNSIILDISASIGGAMYPRDGRSFDEVLQKSDQFMYEKKQEMKEEMEHIHEK